MLFADISKILGNYLLYFALMLLLPLGVSVYFDYLDHAPQPHSTFAFLETLVICLILALFFRFFAGKAKGTIYRRESIILVVSIWLVTTFIAACPFYLSKSLSPVNSLFESMSGLTTTGASMLSDQTIPTITDSQNNALIGLDAVSRGVLFWRSFIQWLGGMGIVVLFLTVLPALGVGGKFLYQAEVSGPIKEAITPRIKETASHLWKFYLGLTILEILLLMWTNERMPFFDALCISFSNLSTGGFSIRNDSIASYHSVATEWIVIAFMILGSINFAFYFHIIRLKFYKIYAPDFFLFLFFVVTGSALVSYFIYHTPNADIGTTGAYSLSDAIRSGTFQAVSAQTSTGFFTANYDLWPFPSQMFMLLLMFIGGMAGSTAGGIKTSRFYILYKILTHRIETLFRPESVRKLIIRKVEIDSQSSSLVLAFFCIVGFFTILGTVFMTLDGLDPETSLGLMASFLNNVGIAFRAAGPLDSIDFLSNFSKIMACFWMLLGRLEYYAILLLFFPAFWKR